MNIDANFIVPEIFRVTNCPHVKIQYESTQNEQIINDAVWKQAFETKRVFPNPDKQGWTFNNEEPMVDWMDLLPPPLTVTEVFSCDCTCIMYFRTMILPY